MSAYAQPAYNAYNVPRTPPRGAQQNDLSGQVPSNQIWAQAYNQASNQYGGNTQAQSFTMPGTMTSQGYDPTTGRYGPMTGGQSNAGNMAYNAIDQRPSPIQANATGVGGSQMPWQDSLTQREAFVGNLSQRLGQYSGGQLTGPVTFDQGQLMQQANDQLANGSFYNPFSQTPDFQRAMGNSTQYMQGNFQNPFGPQANVPQPSFNQQSYSPLAPQNYDMRTATFAAPPPSAAQQQGEPIRLAPVVNAPPRPDYNKPYDPTDDNAAEAAGWQKGIHGGAYNSRTGQYWDGSGAAPWGQQPTNQQAVPQRPSPSPSAARPIEPPSQGTPYRPSTPQPTLPPVVDPIQRELDDKQRAIEYRARNNIQVPRVEMTQEELFRVAPNLRPRPNRKNMNPFSDYDPFTGEVFTTLTQEQLAERNMRQEEHFALNDLQSSGRATPELTAAVRSHF
jgi:hypothetical protein